MRASFLVPMLASAVALSGCTSCENIPATQIPAGQVATFAVTVNSITNADGTTYGPGDGGEADPYPFDINTLTLNVFVAALDTNGVTISNFNRPVSIRVTPGDLDPTTAWLPLNNGTGQGTVRVSHVFGGMAIWAKDGPPAPDYINNSVLVTGYFDAGLGPALPDGGASYTFATGASSPIWFLTPTITQVQRTDNCDPAQGFPATYAGPCTTNAQCFDNTYKVQYQCYQGYCVGACNSTTAALVGDFVEISRPPPATDMVVTDITSDGFYVSDLAAQKFYDPSNPVLTVDWEKLPGTFNSLFVYNYSAPTNLFVGDHLVSLSGTVEEFSGDTQLDFPSWIVVNALPSTDMQPTHELTNEEDCTLSGAPTDSLCGYYTSDYGLKSVESTPVQIRYARPSNIFVDCDLNGDGILPIFANSTTTFQGLPGSWGCYSDQADELPECACYIACTVGGHYPDIDETGNPTSTEVDFDNLAPANSVQPICSELSTFTTYQQWNLVMYSADGGTPFADGGYDGYTEANFSDHEGVRIEVNTADGLSTFNPLDLQKPQYQGITFDITGMLEHIEASRPRWLIDVRQASDVCCHSNPQPGTVVDLPDGGNYTGYCPPGVEDCSVLGH